MGPAGPVPWTALGGGAIGRWFRWDHRRSRPATWVPARDRAEERCGTAYPSGGRGFDQPRGAAPRKERLPGRGPRFSRNGEEEAKGRFLPLDSLLWFLGPCKGLSFCLACGPVLRPCWPAPGWCRAGRVVSRAQEGLTRIGFKNSTKKAPQIRACTWAPKQPNYRPAAATPKQASGSKRAIKMGGGGIPPRLFASGTGREPTSQVLTCGGPNGTTYR